ELHAGIAAAPGGVGDFEEKFFGLESMHGAAVFHGFGAEVGVAKNGIHEVVGYADGIVGVLEKNRGVGFGVGRGSVVAGGDESVRLGFFFRLALDEVDDIGVVDIEDDHFRGAAGLAAGLDYAGEGVETFHETERTAGDAAAAQTFGRGTQGRKIG